MVWGGAWDNDADNLRNWLHHDNDNDADNRNDNVGFRVVAPANTLTRVTVQAAAGATRTGVVRTFLARPLW